MSGFRFRCGSFDGLEQLATTLAQESHHVSEALKQDAGTGSRLAAKLNAAPAIKAYGDRLASGEPSLVEELDKAYRIVVAESARNMMIATVKGLGLFPPSPPPCDVKPDDCAYEDVSAPLPMIAQRLYNDHLRRQHDVSGSAVRQQRRAMTAAFLVDFAHHAGAKLPEQSETYQSLLQEFSSRNFEYAEREAAKHRAAAEFAAAERAAELKARAAAAQAQSASHDLAELRARKAILGSLGTLSTQDPFGSMTTHAAPAQDPCASMTTHAGPAQDPFASMTTHAGPAQDPFASMATHAGADAASREGVSQTRSGWMPRWDTFFIGQNR
jgi:hypothetical protein